MTVAFDVTNTGAVRGDEVPQVYVGSPASPPVPMAVRALAGFERVSLDPGQTKHVTIELAPRAFQYWSVGDARLDDGLGRPHDLRRLVVARPPPVDDGRAAEAGRRGGARPARDGAGRRPGQQPEREGEGDPGGDRRRSHRRRVRAARRPRARGERADGQEDPGVNRSCVAARSRESRRRDRLLENRGLRREGPSPITKTLWKIRQAGHRRRLRSSSPPVRAARHRVLRRALLGDSDLTPRRGRATSAAARSRAASAPCRSRAACRGSPSVGVYGTSGNTSAISSRLGTVHHRVAGRDDEVLRADVGVEREPAALRDVARVDVAPEVPAPQAARRPRTSGSARSRAAP